jgi:hypothetical protein
VCTGCPGGSSTGNPNLLVEPIAGEASGTLSGHVIVVNANQERLADKSGIEVTIDGLANRALTNTNGLWTFSRLPEGIYTITWTKPGFGMTRMAAYRFPGGDVHSVKIWVVEQPHFSVGRLQGSVLGGGILLDGEILGSTGTGASAVRVFVGADQSVSPHPRTHRLTSATSFLDVTPAGPAASRGAGGGIAAPSFSLLLERPWLEEAGFQPGSAVYIVAHADGLPSVSYTDPATAQEVFTTINPQPSPILRIIMP